MAEPTTTDHARLRPSPSDSFPERDRLRLPLPLTSFVGREREVAELAALLCRSGARLVTVTGPGGIGKTSLARWVADDLASRFAGGTLFVDLTPVRDPEVVLPTIAGVIGLGEGRAGQVVEALGARELLLLLDNFEQVVAAAPLVAELLEGCANLAILITSRIRLNLQAERVYPLAPLAVPRDASNADQALNFPAVRLFAERALRVKPDFALTPENAAAVAGICARLDGLPLAIELAAARAALFSPTAMLARLERRLPLLTGGPRDAPARQRTMRDAIAWSYDFLSADQQLLFRRLAVFVGGFTIETAEAVAGGEMRGRTEGETDTSAVSTVLDGIAALVDNSLLRAEDDDSSRFGMLETVREFALEQLAVSGEEAAIRDAHAEHFATVADRFGPADVPNLRAAAAWALHAGRDDLALRLGEPSRAFMYAHEQRGDALRWVTAALAAPGGSGIEALWAAINLSSTEDWERVVAALDRALAAARARGDPLGIAKALGTRAALAEYSGAFNESTALHHEIFGLVEGIPGNEAEFLRMASKINLADLHVWRGDPAAALPLIEETLAWAERTGFRWGVAQGLQTLAAVASVTGNQARAAELYEQVIAIRLELQDRPGVAGALGGIAGVAAGLGRLDDAAWLLGAAAGLRKRINVRYGSHYVRGAQVLDAVRTRMDEGAFAAAWEAGRALTDDDALALARRVLAAARQSRGEPPVGTAQHAAYGLTPRELEVVRLVAAGKSNAEIADELFIEVPTVKRHLTTIYGKLDLPSRHSALAAWAHQQGLA